MLEMVMLKEVSESGSGGGGGGSQALTTALLDKLFDHSYLNISLLIKLDSLLMILHAEKYVECIYSVIKLTFNIVIFYDTGASETH